MITTHKSSAVVLLAISFCIAGMLGGMVEAGSDSEKSTIDDLAFIAGHWKGEAFGATKQQV